MVRDLAGHIPDLREREVFLKACQAHSAQSESGPRPSPLTPVPVETPQPVTWDPHYLEKVKQSLAQHIGPVAGVLVDRTCKRVASRQQLYDVLVTHIPSEKDRAKFLQSVPR